jgi:hypothetical protein
MRWLAAIRNKVRLLNSLDARSQYIQAALGRIESRQLAAMNLEGLHQNEFKVYSQWGEDGIIQKLLRHVAIGRKVFIEFGVEDYTESSTRFLLVNNNWFGLVIDGSQVHVDYIKRDRIYWQYNLKAECSFVTRDNINGIFRKNGLEGEVGLLSVDIDGNDYWVWEAIDSVMPAIVIVEYNSRLGFERAVTIPYDPGFVRGQAHHSMIYYGASLNALCLLGNRKGYAFVGCNSAGNNAFFVRRDLMAPPLKELTAAEGFVQNHFRESRDVNGALLILTHEQEAAILEKLPWVDVGVDDSSAMESRQN